MKLTLDESSVLLMVNLSTLRLVYQLLGNAALAMKSLVRYFLFPNPWLEHSSMFLERFLPGLGEKA